MASTTPASPQSMAPKRIPTMAASALILTLLPTTFGVMILPSRNCTVAYSKMTSTGVSRESVVLMAYSTGRRPPIKVPT